MMKKTIGKKFMKVGSLLLLILLLVCSLLSIVSCNHELPADEREDLPTSENGKYVLELSEDEIQEIRDRYSFIKFYELSVSHSYKYTFVMEPGIARFEVPLTYGSEKDFALDDVAYFEVYHEKTGDLLSHVTYEEKGDTITNDGEDVLHIAFFNNVFYDCFSFVLTFKERAGCYRTVLYGHDGEILNEEVWDFDKLIVAAYKYGIYHVSPWTLPEEYIYDCTPIK